MILKMYLNQHQLQNQMITSLQLQNHVIVILKARKVKNAIQMEYVIANLGLLVTIVTQLRRVRTILSQL